MAHVKWMQCVGDKKGCTDGWKFSEDKGRCVSCPAGQDIQRDEDSCSPCAVGKYRPFGRISACLPCKSGFIAGARGRSKCDHCSSGTYQGRTEKSHCMDCASGLYSEGNASTSCKTCGWSSYSSETGMSSCFACPKNSEIDMSVEGGAKSQQDCTCQRGYFEPEGLEGKPCQKCPRHATCYGRRDPPIASAGYWMDRSYPEQVVSCGGEGCQGGTRDVNSSVVSRCAEGYTGTLCEACAGTILNHECLNFSCGL